MGAFHLVEYPFGRKINKRFHLAEKFLALNDSLQSDWLTGLNRNEVRSKMEKLNFSISPSQLCSYTPSAINAGAKRSGTTCHMAVPQCCYLEKGAKRPIHTKICYYFSAK